MFANAQSINNKINELRSLVVRESPDVVALTETWTHESIADEYLCLEGYDMIVRKDRADTVGGRGGGIVVYVREIFAWHEDEKTVFNQCATVKVKGLGHDLSLHIVYRSPNSTRENDAHLCQWIREMRGDCLIVGDFNFPGIRWDSGCTDSRGGPFMRRAQMYS